MYKVHYYACNLLEKQISKKKKRRKMSKGKELEGIFYRNFLLCEVCRIRFNVEQALYSGWLNSSSTEKQV